MNKVDVKKAKQFIHMMLGLEVKWLWSQDSAALFEHDFGKRVPFAELAKRVHGFFRGHESVVEYRNNKVFGMTGTIIVWFNGHMIKISRYAGESAIHILLVDSSVSTWFRN